MMEAMQRAFCNGVSAAATRPEVPSARADSACRVPPVHAGNMAFAFG